MGNCLHYSKMNQDLFMYLPSEIVIDILSRLPVRSVISCKCFQKSWLQLVENKEFVKAHLSKSSPGLITCETWDPTYVLEYKLFRFFEFEDGLNVEHHDFHHKQVTKFNFTYAEMILGSVDGLVLLLSPCYTNAELNVLYICNPITRDYISLDCPPDFRDPISEVKYGFGSSSVTSQYKVAIFSNETRKGQRYFEAECNVYTLGTGSWRRHAFHTLFLYMGLRGVFVNGNLHWLVLDLSISPLFLRISCFDLETECFSTLSVPFPWNGEIKNLFIPNLFSWGRCLGLCDNTSNDEIVIWSMKEYGIEKSWTKEFVLNKVNLDRNCYMPGVNAFPIKVFKDGDILIQFSESILIYYSCKTKTTQKVNMFKGPYGSCITATLHTPSFLSLKSFGLDVSSF